MKNPGVSNGLFLGVSLTLLMAVVYLIEPKFFMAGWGFAYIGITLLVYILFMVKAGNNYKSLHDGMASFGDLLKPIFLTAVIGGMISTLASYALFNIIDPGLPMELQEVMIDNLESSSLIPEDQMEEMIEAMEEAGANAYTFSKIMMNAAFGAIFGFIMSLIMAAILKNERPEGV